MVNVVLGTKYAECRSPRRTDVETRRQQNAQRLTRLLVPFLFPTERSTLDSCMWSPRSSAETISPIHIVLVALAGPGGEKVLQ